MTGIIIQNFYPPLCLILGCGFADSICTSRRCLAQMLINYNLTSQPQDENCTKKIYVPWIDYQTVSIVGIVIFKVGQT